MSCQTAFPKICGYYLSASIITFGASTSLLICIYRGEKCGFSAPNAKSVRMKSSMMAFPWGIFAPTASRVYQMEISEVFFHIRNCIEFQFQCNFKCPSLILYGW